ncbi:MAG: NRAMP family divalent metal transporter [Gammaproteobacteria bacterium]
MSTSEAPSRSAWRAFGPGLLFAGAAVGVSHLVQATRAGASFGLAALLVIAFACAVKFPAFRAGPHYAAATGRSLLEAYRHQGRWTLVAFAALTLMTMFTVTAAVTLVTAGIAVPVLGLAPLLAGTVGAAHGPLALSALLLVIAAALLASGGYAWLDRFIKIVVPVLTLATLVATCLALGRIQWSWAALLPDTRVVTGAGLAFTVALIGWMPSAIDTSIWSSLWTVARARQQHANIDMRAALLDFDAGYTLTLLLALAFALLGTGLMYGQGIDFANGPAAFATQVIDLYVATLGAWSRPFIGLIALLVMLSTVVTVVDGFPRVIAALVAQLGLAFVPGRGAGPADAAEGDRRVYRVTFGVLTGGALAILAWGMGSFTALIDLATTLSFLTAPVLAFFNHRALRAPEVPHALRPGTAMTAWSALAVVLQAAFAAWYLWFTFGRAS